MRRSPASAGIWMCLRERKPLMPAGNWFFPALSILTFTFICLSWRLLRRIPTKRADKCEREDRRSEEHTSELQSPDHLVCRLLLEKKKTADSISTVLAVTTSL